MDPIIDMLFNDDDFDVLVTAWKSTNNDRSVSRITNWFEQILPTYSDYFYRRFHRLCRDAMGMLLFDLSQQEDLPVSESAMPIEKRLHLFVNYAANIEPLRLISDRFQCVESTAMRVVDDMAERIGRLQAKYIRWPDVEGATQTSNFFASDPNW